eukprot:2166104-Prorocentrum_lima.AAC.1
MAVLPEMLPQRLLMDAQPTRDTHMYLHPETTHADQACIDTLRPGEAAHMVLSPGASVSITGPGEYAEIRSPSAT